MNCYYYEIEVTNKLNNNNVIWGFYFAPSLIQAIERIKKTYSSIEQNKILSLDIREML